MLICDPGLRTTEMVSHPQSLILTPQIPHSLKWFLILTPLNGFKLPGWQFQPHFPEFLALFGSLIPYSSRT